MLKNVGILSFIFRINIWFWLFKPEFSIEFDYFNIYEHFNLCSAELSMKTSFIFSGIVQSELIFFLQNQNGKK